MEAAEAGMSMPLIIPDLQDSQMFALAQAAGRAGIPVLGSSWKMEPWVRRSRYIGEAVEIPSLSYQLEGAYALAWKQSGFKGVWLPCVDDMVSFTAKYRALLNNSGMSFICPDSATLERAVSIHMEKFSGVLQLPHTYKMTAAALYEASERLEYPVMMKSARNRFSCFESAEMLRGFIDQFGLMQGAQRELRMQHFIPGEVSRMASALLLFDDEGRAVRGFTGRRLRVERTQFGPFGETLAARAEWIPELYEGAVELLAAIQWRGFAEVECKQDADGKWQVLEINPRTSGWTCLAEADGAGMLAAYHRICSEGAHLQEACLQRSAAGYRRMIGTCYHDPDWATDNEGARTQPYRWLKEVFLLLTAPHDSDYCYGAWDRRDLKASLLLLWRSLTRAWRLYLLSRRQPSSQPARRHAHPKT